MIRAYDPDAVILVGTPGWDTFGYSDSGNAASYMEVANNPVRRLSYRSGMEIRDVLRWQFRGKQPERSRRLGAEQDSYAMIRPS
ncbi:hypothetical protein [Noviherbaspirillum sp.]|uniref:hypothetical protein n=1 Tax=Noviherbaspirillum sp. TaxID=1926288 RepID=UPI002B46D1FD|nr:hypothetical protein [Noviherbaspirillum sp.]HJV81942.1 hypothetical protein [Noviherbaspirillum sp.]